MTFRRVERPWRSCDTVSFALDPPPWVSIAGMTFQGVRIACFRVAGQVDTDRQAPREQRASAQALYRVAKAGIGSILRSLHAGDTVARFAGDYRWVFLIPCVLDGALIVYFRADSRSSATVVGRAGALTAARPSRDDDVRGSVEYLGNLVTESADG